MTPPNTKTRNPTLADLRPLSLVEVVRKVWVTSIIRRIPRLWSDKDMLHSSHHGFTQNRGVGSAVIQLLNAVETAQVTATPLYASSFDVRRAF